MVTQWLCDLCGAPGYIHPLTEPVMRKKVMKIELPDPKDPRKKITKEVFREIPQTTKIRRQVTQTSKVETVEIPLLKDKQPRAILVQLNFGMENVQKDFCMKCFNKNIRDKVEVLFDFLAGIEDK